MITIDEKKLNIRYQEYLMKIANDPAVSHNLKHIAPKNWMQTDLVSCIFASIIEKHQSEIIAFKDFDPNDYEKVEYEQEL